MRNILLFVFFFVLFRFVSFRRIPYALSKLHHYGIRGIVYNWFSSYLSHRTQTTQIDNQVSSKRNSVTGAPQGSVLGPLLFLIYTNDIYTCSDKLRFYFFADDTNLLYADKNL